MRFGVLSMIGALFVAGCTTPARDGTESAAATQGPLAGFTKLRSDDGGFEVSMPEGRKETRDLQSTDLGEAQVHLFMAGSGQAAFMVGWSEYAAPIADPKGRLEAARDGSLAKSHSKLEKSEPIELDGVRGIDVTGHSAKSGAVRARYFVRGARLYQVVALGAEDAVANAFLDSFTLLP